MPVLQNPYKRVVHELRVCHGLTQGCVITLNQGNISKVKVTVQTYQKSVSGPYLFMTQGHVICLGRNFSQVTWIWMILETIVVHDKGVVNAGPVRTCLVISLDNRPSSIPPLHSNQYGMNTDNI